MKVYKIKLLAGEEQKITTVGNYFRFLSGVADVRVRIENLSIDSVMKVGVGVDLGRIFESIYVYSDVDQTVELMTASGRIDDSRLTGDVDVNGLLSVVNSGASSYSSPLALTILAGVQLQAFGQDKTRLKASIQADNDVFIGGNNTVDSTNGIKVGAGALLSIDNTAEMWVYCQVDSKLRILQEFI